MYELKGGSGRVQLLMRDQPFAGPSSELPEHRLDLGILDAVIVPVGGGGLISGIAIAIKVRNRIDRLWRPNCFTISFLRLC